MAVTASKLSTAPITLDWSNLASAPAGTGPLSKSYNPDAEQLSETWSKLKARFHAGDVGFYDSPTQDEISQATESGRLAEEILKTKQFTDCLFLGIGGSALGPVSLLAALQERCTTGIRFHFQDNPDPLDWKQTLSRLSPEKTLVCSVTKSGTTFETMAQTLLALEWLGKDRWKTHLVAITDPVKGDLKAFATHEGIPTLHIAPSLGGRFSIFSPVGLFPMALAGLSISEFLLGARQVREHLEKTSFDKSPLLILGQELLRHSKQRTTHVCMPYSTRLKRVGDWFVQLWGESLGKDGKGFTPVAAVGATDQHSILQLLRDGPDDKVTWFITVDHVEDEVRIPRSPVQPGGRTYPAFKLLEGHSLQQLLTYEYRATSLVLTRQGRPNITFQLDQLDERNLGALYFSFSILTAFTGTLWEVNPFDQPGVEEAKVYIREALTAEQKDAPMHDVRSAVERLRPDRS